MKTFKALTFIAFAAVVCSCGGGKEDKPDGPITPSVVAVSSVTLSKTEAELVIGNTLQLTATVSPSNATEKNVTWNSSNATVAAVTPTGLVTAKAEGTANITASCGGKSATCKLTVKKPAVAVTSVELDKTEINLYEEETYTLQATVKPDNATDKTITWASSKPDVATVGNDGKVTAVKEGTATITAKAGEKSATCKVTVIAKSAAPLTFTASGSVTISFKRRFLYYYYEYRVNGGDWKNYPSGEEINLTNGQKVSFRARSTNANTSDQFIITGSGTVAASGNIMSLLKKEGDLTIVPSNAFDGLFRDCIALTTAPELPATTLAEGCYSGMFYGCTALTKAPEPPATTLAENCYNRMFYGCTALTKAPELPATTLAKGCYNSMFYGCTALTTAPQKLPASTLKVNCYLKMFYGCTALTKAPELPATTLAKSCYQSMFHGCTALTTVPQKLPASTLKEDCYEKMFMGCTSLKKAPELPAKYLKPGCYLSMFQDCTNLNYVKALIYFIPLNNTGSLTNENWLKNVAKTGTFVKSKETEWYGSPYIPSGWTIITE